MPSRGEILSRGEGELVEKSGAGLDGAGVEPVPGIPGGIQGPGKDQSLGGFFQRPQGDGIEILRQEAAGIREDAERQAQKIQAEELERIRASLRPVFATIQEESGYDLILNYNPAIVIAVSDAIEITDRVLQLLDVTGD